MIYFPWAIMDILLYISINCVAEISHYNLCCNITFVARWPVTAWETIMSPDCITVTSYWAPRRLKSPASLLFTQIKIPKLRVTGLCMGNSPVTGEFPSHMASNAKNVSIWWRHHANGKSGQRHGQLWNNSEKLSGQHSYLWLVLR